ncbi:hypothetical protein CAPTEDRAFT_226585 [Capitella teleta]|uniref:DNA cross-link repair 1A protein n=1 Tax=Capitella teleta TaxID=283909 RepID=R7T410_CAPTE|nr:hypothetical protein CAPTEDRAFT_226585 [Capitella teleta]|eukprot:ELT87607.1 hypothetical protein CAPTEDRAFT_226585 [Capitella teleta]
MNGKRSKICNDSDDDIWEYGKRKKTVPANQKKKKLTKEKLTKKNKQPSIATPSIRDCFSSPSKLKGHCPFCQMPFRCLPSVSSRSHTMECMDSPIIAIEECDNGVECHSENPAHYRKFRHSELASLRAGGPRKSGCRMEEAVKSQDVEFCEEISVKKPVQESCEISIEDDSKPSTSSEVSITQETDDIIQETDDIINTELISELSESFNSDSGASKTTLNVISDDVQNFESERNNIVEINEERKKIFVKDSNQTSLLSFFGSKNSKPSSNQNSAATQLKPLKTDNSGNKQPWTARIKKQCPFYKKIPGTSFTVDAFNYGAIPGCRAYFLSHFHYDHYGGLTKKFQQQIYCCKVTGNLVERKLGVASKRVRKLEMNTLYVIEGVEVTLLDANHCPGSVLFLFRLENGRSILHTGDFRANVDMESYPALQGVKISQLYLDTTYCDPNYAFPPQRDVIDFAVKLAEDFHRHQPNGLIVVGSYTIGKERIFLAIAEALSCKICITRDKQIVMECLDDPCVQRMLTREPSAVVHVLPMNHLRYDTLLEYLNKLKPRFDSVLALQPTGWSHSSGGGGGLDAIRPKRSQGNITIYGVPYSEHSSFLEMKRFVQFIRPEKIIPTVNNGSAESRQKMEKIFHSWFNEKCSPSKKMKQTGLKTWMAS